MTRKHFEKIATVLRSTDASSATCAAMADMLANQNPRFDHSRFMTACGH